MCPNGHGAMVADATNSVNRNGPMTDSQRTSAAPAAAVAHSATAAPAAMPR
jgi:hypothetical protein